MPVRDRSAVPDHVLSLSLRTGHSVPKVGLRFLPA
jgi:hypothetical protein